MCKMLITTMMRSWCIGGSPSAIQRLQCILHHKSRVTSLSITPFLRYSMASRSRSFDTTKCSLTKSESDSASLLSPTTVQSNIHKSKVNFCQICGGPTKDCIPEGDDKLRAVCTLCGNVFYENPKMVVGCLVEHSNKVLLCKRKIQPSYGLWTLPAGYLEVGESAAGGAVRETMEEACADVEIVSPFAQLDIPLIGQSYIIFRAQFKIPDFSPGPESLECALFSLDEIPFESLAFSSVYVTLKMYVEDAKVGKFNFHYCMIDKRPGASPSDPNGFQVSQHMRS